MKTLFKKFSLFISTLFLSLGLTVSQSGYANPVGPIVVGGGAATTVAVAATVAAAVGGLVFALSGGKGSSSDAAVTEGFGGFYTTDAVIRGSVGADVFLDSKNIDRNVWFGIPDNYVRVHTINTDLAVTMDENSFSYPKMRLSTVPIIHPYIPDNDSRFGGDATNRLQFSIAVKLSNMQLNDIMPDDVRQKFARLGANIIERYIVFQNNPWLPNTQLLFRPQPYLHPNASSALRNDQLSMIYASRALNRGSFVGFMQGSVTTHMSGSTAADYMLFSPDNFAIGQFNPNTTHHFYSICIDPATRRMAVTLHVLLNDADNAIVNAVIASFGPPPFNTDLNIFMQALEANALLAASIDAPSIRNFIAGRVNYP
ncbi:MAG: hypothetical protein ACD_69C00093G0001 [uncultured bacterium]|nr:MAG: hypothetical protein ACD_69C00093G0001 [uncultured bacterium]OGT08627.1 MAG: hypothetical protein A2V89_05110 [Gammaproteobacteria bacterium RBG_16_37_9]